jgi:hypothetical protein
MKRGIFIALGAVLLLAGVAAACKSSDSGLKDRVSTLETQVPAANTAAQNTQMVLALQALAAAGIHEFTTSVDAGTLPPGESGPLKVALAAVAAVQWPSALQSQAQDLQAKLTVLLTALATDDINQIKAPADAAHELNDTFPDAVYAELVGMLSLPTPAGGGGEGMPIETSMPMGTPTP